jgi:hypothetical protein
MTFPTDKVDPSDNANVGARGDAIADDKDDAFNRLRRAAAADVDNGLDANTRSRNAWAETRACYDGLDPAPTGTTIPAGPPRASYDAPDRGELRTPIISPSRP